MAMRWVCDGCGADCETPRHRLDMWVGNDSLVRQLDLCARCHAAVEDVLPAPLVRDAERLPVQGERVHR